ncbi:hypothetical protein F506_16920 [Herbaspirillum hiltneri N3]|uniref:Secreted protein n=1 Tax=Herbaspirillum hiltneri N3 TaxID=1262470 RepID=A0ABN4HYV9_9BURK|nr:hypothetical protein F506_16920 [Herbaspirillum hiltneri N3]
MLLFLSGAVALNPYVCALAFKRVDVRERHLVWWAIPESRRIVTTVHPFPASRRDHSPDARKKM